MNQPTHDGDKAYVDSYTIRPARDSDPPERVVSSTSGPVVIELGQEQEKPCTDK